jgi:hypothetical protein
MPMGDHEAVQGRTAVRPDGAGGVMRRSTENCMTLVEKGWSGCDGLGLSAAVVAVPFFHVPPEDQLAADALEHAGELEVEPPPPLRSKLRTAPSENYAIQAARSPAPCVLGEPEIAGR